LKEKIEEMQDLCSFVEFRKNSLEIRRKIESERVLGVDILERFLKSLIKEGGNNLLKKEE
jgi:hypothetical protein